MRKPTMTPTPNFIVVLFVTVWQLSSLSYQAENLTAATTTTSTSSSSSSQSTNSNPRRSGAPCDWYDRPVESAWTPIDLPAEDVYAKFSGRKSLKHQQEQLSLHDLLDRIQPTENPTTNLKSPTALFDEQ